jgi:adenylosuccinate lyase
VPEAFLAVVAILLLYANITSGLLVYPRVIARHLEEELPFMATENILMAAVKQGGNRQDLHEKLRQHSMAAGQRVKVEGCSNDLLQRIAADPAFGLDETGLAQLLDPALYIGRSAEQVDVFLAEVVDPFLADNPPHALTAEIYV